jgi:ABC-type glycerol-3-phosphate transport system permease component
VTAVARAPVNRGSNLGRRAARLPMYAACYLITAATLFPLYFLITNALKTDTGYARSQLGLPAHVTWSNFTNAWQVVGLDSDLLHSFAVSAGASVLCVAVAACAGFGLVQLGGKAARRTLFVILLFMMLTPPVIIIPLYTMMVHLHLANTFLGAILAYGAMYVPFGTYMTYSFFREVPAELFEAARVDGAGVFGGFRHIMLPLGRPALITLAVLLFIWNWNDLLYALILLQTPTTRTAMVAISGLIGQYNVSIPALTAALLIAMIPTLVIFFVFQSRLQRGLTMGAAK